MLQTLPASNGSNGGEYGHVANTSGFSLHACVFANADEPEKLEMLCRYISRPEISEQRLSMTDQGKVRLPNARNAKNTMMLEYAVC